MNDWLPYSGKWTVTTATSWRSNHGTSGHRESFWNLEYIIVCGKTLLCYEIWTFSDRHYSRWSNLYLQLQRHTQRWQTWYLLSAANATWCEKVWRHYTSNASLYSMYSWSSAIQWLSNMWLICEINDRYKEWNWEAYRWKIWRSGNDLVPAFRIVSL